MTGVRKLVTAAAAAVMLLPLAAGSCGGGGGVSPCIEADGEPCDDDPFDLDDHRAKTTAPVKPYVPSKPLTPVKPYVPPKKR